MFAEGSIRNANIVGLKRAGMTSATRMAIRKAIKLYFYSGLNGSKALVQLKEELGDISEVQDFITFIESSKRGISRVTHRNAT